MNTPTESNSIPRSSRWLRDYPFLFKLALACCLASLLTSSGSAAVLIWDADTGTSGPQDGSGNWSGTNQWWNAAGGTNYPWAGTGDQSAVTFGVGSGAAGTYSITNNASISQPTNVTFLYPGNYVITTDGVNAGQLQTIANNGGTSTLGKGFQVDSNVTAVINVPWRQVSASDMVLGTNSVLTFAQGTFGSLGQMTFKGAGPSVSTINATNGTWGGANNPSGTTTADGVTFNVIGNAIVNFGTRFDIARSANPAGGYPIADAVVNVGGAGANAQLNVNTSGGNNTGNHLQVSRGGPADLNILSGGLVSTVAGLSGGAVVAGNLRIVPDSNNSRGRVTMSGGTLNLGIGPAGAAGFTSSSLSSITMFDAIAPNATALAILNISGGTVATRAITIGSGAAFGGNATNWINISGGTVYLDALNISINTPLKVSGTNYAFNLSGATIGATATWSPACTVPINLTNINGDVTFQAADAGGTAFNMSLGGALTGAGGLKKTGAGVLTINGTNKYSGTTVISNGTLVVSTILAPVNGPVQVEGGAVASGLPVSSVLVANVGQTWTVTSMTYNSGTPTADFNFGSFPPSTTIAPIQVNGNLAFNVTPLVNVEGTLISVGDYPLWKYTGTLSGTVPTTANSLPAGTVATIVNNTGAKTIVLHVTSSLVNPQLSWKVGSGVWDTTSPNWLQAGITVAYSDGKPTVFDDSATGPFPITINNTGVRSPGSLQINTTNSYTISGSGSINGSTILEKNGTGELTLAGTNTYTGGTLNNGGKLNINYGGDGVGNSAIGTGPLTNALGSTIDNTSGHPITMITPIAEYWVDDFTFAGTTNLNTGPGAITLGNTVTLTVASNVLEVDGVISDGGLARGLTKVGNGTLVLSNVNTFAGGLTLSAGNLNLNQSGADGAGLFTLIGGTFDNTSGSPITLGSTGYGFSGNFTFNGTTNVDMGAANVSVQGSAIMTLNGSTLFTGGALNGANTALTKNGPGTWTIQGAAVNVGVFSLAINGGVVNCNRDFPYASFVGQTTVNTNGMLAMLNATGTELFSTAGITLAGGVVEMNGDSENFLSVTFNSGTLRNSTAFTTSTLTLSAGVSLAGANCIFDVTNDANMTIAGVITNSGSLVKTGGGVLTLASNNTYTGNTIISNGTLALNFPSLATNSTVTVASNGVLNLNFANSETNLVTALVLGGVSKAGGIYNATTDPLYITGSGSLQIPSSSTINPAPGVIQSSVAGGNLNLAWPTNAGWFLQTQTNSRSTGLGTNWSTVAGSDTVTNTSITINPANGTVFFRLLKP